MLFAAKISLTVNVILSCDILFRKCGVLAFAVMMVLDRLICVTVYMFPETVKRWYLSESSQELNIFGYFLCVLAVGSMYVAVLVQKGVVKRCFN
jgi:hypothetical protein